MQAFPNGFHSRQPELCLRDGFEFAYKDSCVEAIPTINLVHLGSEVQEFLSTIQSFPVDASDRVDLPRTLRASKEAILSQHNNLFSVLQDESKKLIMDSWEVPGKLALADYGFFVYQVGSKFPSHVDNGVPQTNVIFNTKRKFTILFYLSEPEIDYEGSNLVFNDLVKLEKPVSLTPRKLDIVAWPSSAYFRHEVTTLVRGQRIVFAMFFDVISA